jgi:hypothetical protein
MAKVIGSKKVSFSKTKKTSIGKRNLKTSSMNKHKRRNKGMLHVSK